MADLKDTKGSGPAKAKDPPKAGKRTRETIFIFLNVLFRRNRRHAKRPRYGAPASTYAGLQATSTQGGKQFKLSTSVNSLGTIFPDRIIVPMRYTTTISFTSTLGVPSGNLFSGNSVYDPNQTGVGHQAYGFDQLSAYYYNYLVTHSSCSVGPIYPSSTAFPGAGAYRAGLQASNVSGLSLSDIAMWQETGDGLTVDGTFGSSYAPGSRNQSMMAMKRSASKMLGVTPITINTGQEFTGTPSADPASQWYWKFFIQTYDQATTASFSARFMFTYYTVWSGRAGSVASS